MPFGNIQWYDLKKNETKQNKTKTSNMYSETSAVYRMEE